MADTVRDPSTPGEVIDELGFDEVLERLQRVVSRLEQGNLGLEEALKTYEEGVGLARRGHEVLDGAEKRVELLVRRGRDGEVTRPLDPEAEEICHSPKAHPAGGPKVGEHGSGKRGEPG